MFIEINNLINVSNIVSIITKTIDFFAIFIIGISFIHIIISTIKSLLKTNTKEGNIKNNNVLIKSFINSLVLALEFESANAILKMGVFVSNATGIAGDNISMSSNNINNFLFFVAVLSVRMAINQTLKKYNIEGK